MLVRANELKGYALHGLDGDIGSVKDFLFDDKYWTIRYLAAETGTWIPNRQVLISPYSLGAVHVDARTISVDLTKDRIAHSPPLSSDEPVSRQYEESFFSYFQYPMYFGGGNVWGAYPAISRDPETWRAPEPGVKHWDAHLRSANVVSGYHVQTAAEEIGHVKDFILDDETWAIRYLVVDTRNFWPGKSVLVAPRWISSVSWTEWKVFTTLTSEQIKSAPEYTDDTAITREYETLLHLHYKEAGYWVDESAAVSHAR
jgi:sporulation protein YlmC with PRC-barrel domain